VSDATLRAIEQAALRAGFRRERAPRTGPIVLPRFADIRYGGRLSSGRRGTIGFAGVAAKARVRLAVAADEAVHFAVVKQGWADWVAAAFGLAEPVNVRAPDHERALLARRTLRDAIQEVFVWEHAESLELASGELVYLAPFFAVPPSRYGTLLHRLDRIATWFDRAPIRVRALRAERRALSGVDGLRCAYCHGSLSGDEDGLVACECCATVLHSSCWRENARCPVLGCPGEDAEGR
jgi:hypothetical protein